MDPWLELVHGVQDDLSGVIRFVVGQFDFLKGDQDFLVVQLFWIERGVWMQILPVGWRWIGFASHQPGGSVIGIPENKKKTQYFYDQQSELFSYL